MVQRKLPTKLDHIMVNSKPLLASLKQSSLLPQHQDAKKKKMKKSGKTTTFENFRSPPARTPPPQKQQRSSPVRASPSSTPNYMKSTSSSDARKERSPHKSSSGAKSGQNPAKASTRTTSLRALTKAPSFKPARAKKCSQVVMCEDLEVQRATCSSTLKDSKFPCYLELSPGGTESQGTSAMKVCPYTYCSLNGHHRLPLPPLKCFVSARRRALKGQRSFKIGCLSPRRSKPSAGEEENMEFSVEIFCKERADEDDEIQENRDLVPASAEEAEELRHECLSEEDHGSLGNQSDSEDSDMEGMEDSALFIDAGVSEETDLDKNGCHVIIQNESTLKTDNNNEEEEEETGCIIDENILQKSLDEEEEEKTGFIIDEISDEKSFDEESMSSGAWLSDDDDDDTQSSISCLESSSSCVYVEETTQVSDEEICRENMIPPEDQESNDSNDSICSDCVEEIHNVDEQLMVEVRKTQKMASENQTLDLELPNLRGTAKNRRETEEELGEFNPRGPNFLPLEPDPEAERVSLKHQSMDERKNGEEWMVDYALRQAVSKLAPARRKKVALLVEAFETVSPIPKFESHLSHTTKLFPPPSRSIQACS
ncbi:calmodulin binding protein PICBP-like isoform X1 [Ipomoea triloba]|uniref:calmodulin binding protein PICBP-like isoform X1 n=1 Tax=Ipomoea triloba TaxID=35885 RepID=UPI00125E27D5|nr:calmodulin binding protein PICBP-like isoform X1 [Ipomoea triloba]